ncbi:hypothetical protein ANCCAN_23966 [Ancylostoma caninum]|uniref:Uncharacterized protein n=1 Tax=Ancylostoma caninum TaxID=29170 RepID=A0A368FDL6_ANCCA|nr:hypothetical protein ANCCAN_23966 [Ancylostoma caninum]
MQFVPLTSLIPLQLRKRQSALRTRPTLLVRAPASRRRSRPIIALRCSAPAALASRPLCSDSSRALSRRTMFRRSRIPIGR